LTSSSTRTSPGYVLDTNALIWYLTGSKKLSADELAVFQAAERGETELVISAVVLAELFYADRKHKLFEDFAQQYSNLKMTPFLRFISFNPDDVLDFPKDTSIPEMHDRILVGLARRLGLPLVTVDPVIRAAGLVPIVW
jgi:PIN domain nuclease of toxin-antitoxin system